MTPEYIFDIARRVLADPLADDQELILAAEMAPALATQLEARLARRRAGYDRNIRGGRRPCRRCGQEVPVRVVAVDGIARWLCLRLYHTLDRVADLQRYGVCVEQLPVWTERN